MSMPGSAKAPAINHAAKEASVSTTTPWVRRYLNARPKDVLLPVPKEYIADGFNLVQLAPIVERIGFQVMGPQAVEIAKRLVELPSPQPSYPIYRLALQLILNEDESQEANILRHPLIQPQAIQQAAEALYLMVHARFVLSPRGLDALRRILLNSPVFGKCPRIQCDGTMLLPYGASNDFSSNNHPCQRYCPSCGNLWNCWDSKTDGCAWGPSLCYLLLMAHGHELFPRACQRHASAVLSTDIIHHHPNNPSIFGFRIHPAAAWGRPVTG
jgi:casein kinase II subunit beta